MTHNRVMLEIRPGIMVSADSNSSTLDLIVQNMRSVLSGDMDIPEDCIDFIKLDGRMEAEFPSDYRIEVHMPIRLGKGYTARVKKLQEACSRLEGILGSLPYTLGRNREEVSFTFLVVPVPILTA